MTYWIIVDEFDRGSKRGNVDSRYKKIVRPAYGGWSLVDDIHNFIMDTEDDYEFVWIPDSESTYIKGVWKVGVENEITT